MLKQYAHLVFGKIYAFHKSYKKRFKKHVFQVTYGVHDYIDDRGRWYSSS